MPLSDIVNVSIVATATSPTRPGFGTPLVAAFTTVFPGRTAEYSSLSEMVTAGFAVTDPAYKAASAIFSQNPRVKNIKVGRRALAYTQVTKFTVLDATTGDVYAFSVGGIPITYTVPSSSTTTTVATALAALITAASVPNLASATSAAAVVTMTSNLGKLVDFLPDVITHMTVADNTADPGIATDLAAILAVDSDWYGLVLDSQGHAEILAAAAWTEANKKLFICNSSDSACADPASTTDTAYLLKQSAYARTALLFAQTQLLCYSGGAWMGNRFPFDPGSDTWAFKTLAGVPADNLNDGQVHAVENKNANVYSTIAGVNITQFGKSSSGEFVDITRFIDFLTSEMQIQIFGALANAQKIPFTDAGLDIINAVISAVLQEGINVGGLAATPKPVVNMPTAASVDAIDKAARNVPGVTFQATLAGAIHSLQINGTVSV